MKKHFSFGNWREATLHHISRRAVNAAQDIMAELVERTPVRTGTARGNWNLSLNEPDRTFDAGHADASGTVTINRGCEKLNDFVPGDKIIMTNATPYIGLLESGVSRQSPGGMVSAVATRLAAESEFV
ncbi:MAG: hypothetical protein Q4G68_13275 [Planctomycetia bacterium]|nr:hypothetical protein [Planctomycetia bacterium]